MSRNTTELILAIILIMMPFLGFPASWKTIFYVLVGLAIIVFVFRSHLRRKSRQRDQFLPNNTQDNLAG